LGGNFPVGHASRCWIWRRELALNGALSLALMGGIAHAQSTSQGGGTATERSSGQQVPQVDAANGRPVDQDGTSNDIVDQAANRNAAGPDRDSGSVRRIVPAYIALPPVSDAAGRNANARSSDRAFSQRYLPGETVKDRRRPEYSAIGFTAGGIRILPYLTTGVAYDSNIYAVSPGRDDIIFSGTAGFSARSDWGRHALAVTGNIRRREYGRFDSEDATTYKIDGQGRLDLAGRNTLTAHLLDERVVLNRAVADEVVSQALPTLYRRRLGELTGHVEYGPIEIDLTGSAGRQTFKDNFSVAGMPLDQQFRNFDSLGGQLDVAVDAGGLRSFYGQLDYERRRFDVPTAGVSRDADVYKFIGGMRGGITKLIRGNIGVGYMLVDFKQANIESLRGVAIDAELDWLVSELTTVSFTARRNLRTAAQQNSRGTILTSLQLGIDHELRRNVIISLTLQQQWNDYIGDIRRARATGASLGAIWLLDRHLQVRPEISYMRRTDRGFDIDASPKDAFAGIDLTYRF
jgi:hypothetical protein